MIASWLEVKTLFLPAAAPPHRAATPLQGFHCSQIRGAGHCWNSAEMRQKDIFAGCYCCLWATAAST